MRITEKERGVVVEGAEKCGNCGAVNERSSGWAVWEFDFTEDGSK